MTTTRGMNLRNEWLMKLKRSTYVPSPVEDVCEGPVNVDGDAEPGRAEDPDGVEGYKADTHHHVCHAVQHHHHVHQGPVSLLLGQHQLLSCLHISANCVTACE